MSYYFTERVSFHFTYVHSLKVNLSCTFVFWFKIHQFPALFHERGAIYLKTSVGLNGLRAWVIAWVSQALTFRRGARSWSVFTACVGNEHSMFWNAINVLSRSGDATAGERLICTAFQHPSRPGLRPDVEKKRCGVLWPYWRTPAPGRWGSRERGIWEPTGCLCTPELPPVHLRGWKCSPPDSGWCWTSRLSRPGCPPGRRPAVEGIRVRRKREARIWDGLVSFYVHLLVSCWSSVAGWGFDVHPMWWSCLAPSGCALHLWETFRKITQQLQFQCLLDRLNFY